MRKQVSTFCVFLTVAAVLALFVPAQLSAKPVAYALPEENTALKPGPNLEAFQNNCTSCHSSDYIKTQPQGPKFKDEFWKSEVTKMIKVYGAPIDDADVPKIIEYLSATY